MDRKYALRSFTASRCRHLFIGHSHRPLVITRKHLLGVDLHPVADSIQFPVADEKRRIFNCGSVGQPRDGDKRSCYLIYDSRRRLVEFYRVAYDTEKTVRAMRKADLPESLAKRLRKGI